MDVSLIIHLFAAILIAVADEIESAKQDEMVKEVCDEIHNARIDYSLRC